MENKTTTQEISNEILRSYEPVCPKCKEEGEESKLHLGGGFHTSIGVTTYYDSSGSWHEHDPNISKGNWSCSRKHKGSYSKKNGCPSANACKHKESLCIVYENPKPKEVSHKVDLTTGSTPHTMEPKNMDISSCYFTPYYYTTVTQFPGAITLGKSNSIDLKNLVLGEGEDTVQVAINVKGVVYTGTLTVSK